MSLRDATVMSQARGFSGTPNFGHCCDAARSASWTASSAAAKSRLRRNSAPSTCGASDGPYAEAKEHLAGFFLVDCVDEARALEIAGRIPEAPLGLVEVRPVMDLSSFEP